MRSHKQCVWPRTFYTTWVSVEHTWWYSLSSVERAGDDEYDYGVSQLIELAVLALVHQPLVCYSRMVAGLVGHAYHDTAEIDDDVFRTKYESISRTQVYT